MKLQGYLDILSAHGELKSIVTSVSANLELAALCRREFATEDGGQALLFQRVDGSSMPVAANLFGSARRLCLLLQTYSLEAFAAKINKYLEARQGSAKERLRLSENLCSVTVNDLQVATGFDLTSLPAIRSWPGETGRYLTLPLAVTRHPQSGELNLGLYRAQIISADRLAVNFSPGSGAAEHLKAAKACNRALPVSIFLGADPVLIWAAAAPLPDGCNEFAFCSNLLNIELTMTEGLSQPLPIPADAELVIEGEIRPNETVTEGPFGNHTGQYVTRRDCPLMRVTAVRRRLQPVLPLTVVGPPPSENIMLAAANEVLIREMVTIDFPQVSDLWMPRETFFHGVTILAVKPQSASQVKELLYALWREGPLSRSRLLVVVDEDISIRTPGISWWRSVNRLQNEKIYHDNGRLAIDATGVDPASLVSEDPATEELLQRRAYGFSGSRSSDV